MRISSIAVTNLRAIREETLHCGSLTTLVGRNGAGKSTFLQALDLFYHPTSVLTVEDFHDRDISTPVVIKVAFSELRPQEIEAFGVYLDQDTLTVTKKYVLTDATGFCSGKYYASRKRFRPFIELRSMTVPEMTKALSELIDDLVSKGHLPTGTEKPKTKPNLVAFMDQFETEHESLTEPIEDEAQFFGDKNVGGGKLDKFTQFVYIPAVRDVAQDTTEKRAAFTQLLDLLVLPKINAHPRVVGLPEILKREVESVYQPAVLGDDLKKLETSLNEALKPFVPNAEIALNWGELPTVTFDAPPVLPRVSEDAFVGEIGKKGHGLQRAIIMILLGQLARVRNAAQQDANTDSEAMTPSVGVNDSEKGDVRLNTPDLILAIEEPELYQHPQRCRHFASVLRDLTTRTDSTDPSTQVIQTTHSPFFIALEQFEEVRIVHKRQDAEGCVGFSCISSESLESLRRKWVAACGLPDDKVSIGSMLSRALRAMTSTVNEGFFADRVVLVEGYGDVGALGGVAKTKGMDWVSQGVAVLPVHGKTNIGAPFLVFSALQIPTYFVFDGDDHHKGKGNDTEKSTKKCNRSLLRLASRTEEDFPSQCADNEFGCFSGTLESYCRAQIGNELYKTITDQIAGEIGWESDDVLKNTYGAESFVERVYANGSSLPLLESMVERIAEMAKVGSRP